MTIATLAQYGAALKERVLLNKTSITNTQANGWISMTYGSAGNSANGVVPTDTTYPINFSSGSGYVTSIEASCTYGPFRVALYDLLFMCGSYAYNSGTTTLTSQPSFSSRIPGGTDYRGLEVWLAGVGASGSGATNFTLTYTDQSGGTGHSSGLSGLGSIYASGSSLGYDGRLQRVPLAAGDTGIQKIESVSFSGGSGGAYNVYIMRPLALLYLPVANTPLTFGLEQLGMPQVWGDSCLLTAAVTNIATSPAPVFDLSVEIASA
jgi:hypothetical protein